MDLDVDVAVDSGPLEVVSSRMGHLWDSLCRVYGPLTERTLVR
jgi:hypothetical protein